MDAQAWIALAAFAFVVISTATTATLWLSNRFSKVERSTDRTARGLVNVHNRLCIVESCVNGGGDDGGGGCKKKRRARA